jgi:hypothetical protein
MVSPLPIDPDTITVASVAYGVALSYLAVALTTVQVVPTASCECVAAIDATSQQEQATMAVAAATTSGADTAPIDLVAALTALQA